MRNRLKWLVDHELLEVFIVALNVYLMVDDLVRHRWHGDDYFFIFVVIFFTYGIARDYRASKKSSSTEIVTVTRPAINVHEVEDE
jgi:hypothetical protein